MPVLRQTVRKKASSTSQKACASEFDGGIVGATTRRMLPRRSGGTVTGHP
jgi:hypothetical protein